LDYQPLEKSQFRLLQLQPGSWHDPIDCQSIVSDNHEFVNYSVYYPPPRGDVQSDIAILSYDVKSSTLTPLRRCFGEGPLMSTMKTIREQDASCFLFVAELCINFDDSKEYDEQICQSSTIVRSASRFVIPMSLKVFMKYADQRLPRLRKSLNQVLQCGQSIELGDFKISIMCNECRIDLDVGHFLCLIPFERSWARRCNRFIPSWPISWTWIFGAGKTGISSSKGLPWLSLNPYPYIWPADIFDVQDEYRAVQSLDRTARSIAADWDFDVALEDLRTNPLHDDDIKRLAKSLLRRPRLQDTYYFSLVKEFHGDSNLNLIDFVRLYYILASEANMGGTRSQSRWSEASAFLYLMKTEKPSGQRRMSALQQRLLREKQEELNFVDKALCKLNRDEKKNRGTTISRKTASVGTS
jgi:hypothetical protein